MDPGTTVADDDENTEDKTKKLKPENGNNGGRTPEERDASAYAWEYFKYHAQQRQAVFRFYLLIIGASLAGYAAHANSGKEKLYGIIIITMSFLFYRLDKRSYKLVKLAEDYLKIDELKLRRAINEDAICIVGAAETKKSKEWPLCWVQTFRQIYQIMFWLFGLLGCYVLFGEKLDVAAFIRNIMSYMC